MSKSSTRKRPHAKRHDATRNVRVLGAEKVERLLHGETEAETLLKARKAEEEATSVMRREIRQQQEVARQNLHIRKKEEEAMSTLRESFTQAIADKAARAAKLQATMDDWGEDEPVNAKPTEVTTTPEENMTHTRHTISVSEGTFNYVRAHPYTTKADAVAALAKDGYNVASTGALISHMVRQRLVSSDANGKLTAIVKAYTPLKATPKITGRKPTVQPARMEHKQARIADSGTQNHVKPSEGIAALASKPDVAYNIKSLLDEISVNEARALYLELKSMFGGN